MGWLNHTQQQEVLSKYGKQAIYRCDYDECKSPGQLIFVGQLEVQDPRGGYFPKPEGAPDFLPKQPKRTYHLECDRLRRGVRVKEQKKKEREESKPVVADNGYVPKAIQKIADMILAVIVKKPKKEYWTAKRCFQQFKGEAPKKELRRAVRHLRKTGMLRREGRYLYPGKPSPGQKRARA